MRLAAIRPASLDAPIGDEDSNNFAEVVQDEAAFNNSVAGWPPAVRTTLGVSDTQKAVDIEPYELPGGARMPSAAIGLANVLGPEQVVPDQAIDDCRLTHA